MHIVFAHPTAILDSLNQACFAENDILGNYILECYQEIWLNNTVPFDVTVE